MFYVRNSKMIGREHFIFKGLEDEEDSEILSSFIIQITVLLLLSIMKAKTIKSLVVLSLIKKATYGW